MIPRAQRERIGRVRTRPKVVRLRPEATASEPNFMLGFILGAGTGLLMWAVMLFGVWVALH